MYVTFDELKKRNIEVFESLTQNYVEDRLSALSKEVEEHCNTKFIPTQDIFRCDVTKQLKTRNKPLLEVSKITINNSLKIENLDYYVYPEQSLIEIEDTMQYARKKRAIEIEYTYGYKEVPATVKDVIIELLRFEEEEKEASINMESETWEDHTYSKNKTCKQSILSRLDKYVNSDNVTNVGSTNKQVRVMLL